MTDLTAYFGLFTAAFAAATLIPAQSEAVLVGLLVKGSASPGMLLAVATLGNVLGSLLNWLLGRMVERLGPKRWVPVSEPQLERAQQRYHRSGRWSLLLSWVPIIGDPLTVVAGTLREPLWSFLLLVTLANGGRYLLLAGVTLGWLQTRIPF